MLQSILMALEEKDIAKGISLLKEYEKNMVEQMDTKEMDAEMFIISREQVKALSDRLKNPGQLASCVQEVKKMLEIKSVLLWRADAACACVGPGPMNRLSMEVQLIQDILAAIEAGDSATGASLLNEYAAVIS